MTLLRLLVFLAIATPVQAETIRMAVTTSFQNSGLSEVLLPAITADTGVEIQLLVVGTGQALALGRAGDVDAVLVHARVAEEGFVASGYGTERVAIMWNDFVLIGPGDDPAGVAQHPTAASALSAIAMSEVPFVSRGDSSGTHQRELALWEQAGVSPEGAWYREVGAGMGAALNVAVGVQAYVLSDRASWLAFANKGNLALLFQGDTALFNQYSFLPVSAARHAHVKSGAVAKVQAWLVSDRAQEVIDGYTLAGEQLFTWNAQP